MKSLKIFVAAVLLFSFFCARAIDTDEGARQMTRRIAYYPLSNDDQSGGVITLDTELRYLAKGDIDFPIVIDADNVYLDLNGYIVTHNNNDENIITINASKKNIHVVNGIIKNSAGTGTGSGVLVSSGAAKICLDGLKVVDCGNGAKFDGTDGSEIIDCELIALDLVFCSTGIHLNYVNDSSVEKCKAKKCTEIGFAFERCSGNSVDGCKAKKCGQKGFSLSHCQTNCLQDCKAQETFGSSSVVAGFVSDSGSGNLIQNCVAEKTKTSAWEFCNKVYGILLTGTEEKTKIIDCVVRETDMTSTVSALSFGIALEGAEIEGGSFLNDIDSENYGDRVNSVAWSPDGKYLAVGGKSPDSYNELQIFSFDGTSLLYLSTNTFLPINCIVWSPNGKYLAVATEGSTVGYILVFAFDGTSLYQVESIPYGHLEDSAVYSVDWSPNGKYLAVGGSWPDSGYEIQLYSFDGLSLDLVTSKNYGISVYSVDWSPNGKYLAVGGAVPDSGYEIQLYSFDGLSLDLVTSKNYGSTVDSVDWSPNGKYLAVGGTGPDSGYEIQLYSFDGLSLDLVTSENYGSRVYSVAWSSNGKYLAVGGSGPFSGDPGGTDEIKLFSFDGSDLTFVASKNYGTSVRSVDWSPRGNYLAVGGEVPSNNNEIQVFSGIPMYGPTDCLIKNNLVLDTMSYGEFVGTGIFGTVGNDFVGNNYFLRNICCDNNVNFIYGIPNTFYGAYFPHDPFDNVAGYVS